MLSRKLKRSVKGQGKERISATLHERTKAIDESQSKP
jgi:hypothetical protein